MAVLRQRLEAEDVATIGWLGDGWTRERANSESLVAAGIIPDVIIVFVAPQEVLTRRLSGRRQDPVTSKLYHVDLGLPEEAEVCARLAQREDDAPASVVRRLEKFTEQRDATLAPWREAGV